MTIRTKIICLPLLFLLGAGLISATTYHIEERVKDSVILPSFSEEILRGYKNALRAAVDVEAELIAQELKNVSGEKDRSQAIIRLTDQLRFFDDKSGYFFTYTLDGVRINVPINKSKNGQSCIDLKDDKGGLYVKDFVDAAKNGGGYVRYYFEKEGKGTQPKLSYVRLIPGTDILIGTGVYIDSVEAETALLQAKVRDKTSEYTVYKAGTLGLFLVLVGAVSFFVVRSITTPLSMLSRSARTIAAGNLDHTSDASGFTGEILDLYGSLRLMVGTLKDKIREADERSAECRRETERAQQAVHEAEQARHQAEGARREGMLQAAGRLEQVVERLTSASEELSAQIEESSRGTESQRERLSETAASVAQMSSSVLDVARNSSDAAQNAVQAMNKAQSGERVVDQSILAFRKVEASTSDMKGQIDELSEKAGSIGAIMQIIEDIADQTNLLALNAAIEAARAGDAGRGFAVVADEVRKLAEKTMGATKDVGGSIREIQGAIDKTLRNMGETGTLVKEAASLSGESGRALGEIVTLSEQTSARIQSIAAAAEEQSAASEQITRSTEEVSTIASDTADAMNQSAHAVSDLARIAGELKELIDNMR